MIQMTKGGKTIDVDQIHGLFFLHDGWVPVGLPASPKNPVQKSAQDEESTPEKEPVDGVLDQEGEDK
jgi:hypothetical protein